MRTKVTISFSFNSNYLMGKLEKQGKKINSEKLNCNVKVIASQFWKLNWCHIAFSWCINYFYQTLHCETL